MTKKKKNKKVNIVISNASEERRKDPRLETNVPLKLFQDGGDIITETGNISKSGAYCKVSRYIAPMTKLDIQLLLPIRKNGKSVQKKIVTEGIIVRVEESEEPEHYNIAIFFSTISQRDANNISDYVSSYLEQDV